jgi:DNA-binding CsgD family transcriptional regulator/tetratricopeptide (TPR) repeat protein
MLLGRSAECARIAALLETARSGQCGALVVCGEAGIGKSTLLEFAVGRAGGMQVLRTRGYETESELPFAGLADLLRPALELLPALPAPQAAALRSALALGPPIAGDRFSVCAATLGILALLAEKVPVLLLVDDLQWLDASSQEAVLFAGRRLAADGIALLFAFRDSGNGEALDLGLPQLHLAGLTREDADELSQSLAPGTVPEGRSRLYDVTAGNPLGIIELAETMRSGRAEWALTAPRMPAGSPIERALRARLARLPDPTRRALLLVAAAGGGEIGTVLHAAGVSGLKLGDFAPAETAGLITIDQSRIEFCHPLQRSVLYHCASTPDRCEAHAALAAALAEALGDAAVDVRAWHLAVATLAPDETVAAQLEETAMRARSRAGYVAAARGFEHAARLSTGSARSRRLVWAAECWQLAGGTGKVLPLLTEALPIAADRAEQALIRHLSGNVGMWRDDPGEVLQLLVASAEQAEAVDTGRAAQMYADAVIPYVMLGQLDNVEAVARRAFDLGQQVDGVSRLSSTIAIAGAMALDRRQPEAAQLLQDCRPDLDQVDPLVRAQDLRRAALVWTWLERYDQAEPLLERVITSAREAGALGVLPQALAIASEFYFRTGRWADARACASESVQLAEETQQASLYGLFVAARMDAVQGPAEQCVRTAARIMEIADRFGAQIMALLTGSALGLLALGEGDTDVAITRLEVVRQLPVTRRLRNPVVVPWMYDLAEAYIRDGREAEARDLLAAYAPHSTTELWPHAAAARCHAMLADNSHLVDAFQEALAARACASMPFERARTQLCFGERLRRARHRAQARIQLHDALEVFDRLGATLWAQRAQTELRATGETVRRDSEPVPRLTPQELQVALVVGRGASNREAAATLFLSQKTIEYHLSNIYRKTNIHCRADLADKVS